MSEMVERVASALRIEMEKPAPTEETSMERSVRSARAAILAMREPTESMLKADVALGGFGYGDDVYQADPREVWQAMIDEALK